MSRLSERLHASAHQPRIVTVGLARDAEALSLLAALYAGPALLGAILGDEPGRRQTLRRLVDLSLVDTYVLRGQAWARLRRLPVHLRRAVDAELAARLTPETARVAAG